MGLIDPGVVLGWGLPRLRDLPWRTTRDPWAVLVSEVMLQQTHVPRVVPKWFAFLDAFPTPAACAAASLADVLRAWQGLGYPRRARNLHLAAARIAAAGRFPDTLAELLTLPGVGPYTARAVLAFAFEHDAAVVDTNTARVYARVEGRSLTGRVVQTLADEALPRGDAWAWNQSLMDLGAAVCRPTSPTCGDCPLIARCAWAVAGWPDPDPAVGSAGVSTRQAPFAGSDREARGRLLRALGAGPVGGAEVAASIGRDRVTAARLVDDLVRDGLVTRDEFGVRLPGDPLVVSS